MFSNTQKAILVAGLAINLAAIVTVSAVMHQREVRAHSIQLGTIVVTPADAERRVAADGTIEMVLPPIRVTAADAERRVAANGTIDMVLPPVAVTAADAGDAQYAASGQDQDADNGLAVQILLQTLDTLSPGQYLESSLSLDVLGTLAFDRAGR
ncbi:MAG TPA: hypothetical protein VFM15_05375 [Gammaproteobacteria bacterium]|nr:hypothetical protein [Gammaproteobacteria bacterium]